MRTSLLLSSCFAFLLACGGGQPEPTTPSGGETAPPASSTPSSDAPAGDVAWSDGLPSDQKVAIMKTRVLPRMSKVLHDHDATHFADVTCKTCHGPKLGAPKDFLPKLAMKDGKMTAFAEKPEVAKFMAETVVPEMAAALGEKPYDPETKQGFGCGGCHAVEMK